MFQPRFVQTDNASLVQKWPITWKTSIWWEWTECHQIKYSSPQRKGWNPQMKSKAGVWMLQDKKKEDKSKWYHKNIRVLLSPFIITCYSAINSTYCNFELFRKRWSIRRYTTPNKNIVFYLSLQLPQEKEKGAVLVNLDISTIVITHSRWST